MAKSSPLRIIHTPYERVYGKPSIFDEMSSLKEKLEEAMNHPEEFQVCNEKEDYYPSDLYYELVRIIERCESFRQGALKLYKTDPYKEARENKQFAERNVSLRGRITEI